LSWVCLMKVVKPVLFILSMNKVRRLSGFRLVTLMYSVVWLVCVSFWLGVILIACYS
jgi:hypothetical protein